MALLHAAALVDGDFGVVHVDHGLHADSAKTSPLCAAAARSWPFLSVTTPSQD